MASAVSMAMPTVAIQNGLNKNPAISSNSFFNPLTIKQSKNSITVSSNKFQVQASIKEKAISGLSAGILTASMVVPQVAEAASGSGGGVLESTNPPTISLPEQLGHFKDVVEKLKEQVGEKETQRLVSEAVYLFSIGGNDYFVYYKSHPNATLSEKKEYVGLVTDKLTEALKEIINIGGRKYAFQNVGSLGCLPGNIADGQCDEGINVLARLHNQRLLDIFENLKKDSPIVYSIFDYYRAISEKTLHASQYGFETGTVPCCRVQDRCTNERNDQVCSDFSKYVWFDGAHTTEACNWQLSKEIWNGDKNAVAPMNLKQLYYYKIDNISSSSSSQLVI